jgi:hypothetical protein
MAYDLEGRQKGYLTLANRIIGSIVDTLTTIAPENAMDGGVCKRVGGTPPEGKWCANKFADNIGRLVRPSEARVLIALIESREDDIKAHLSKEGESEYWQYFLEFRDFCRETLPGNGEDDSGYGFHVK